MRALLAARALQMEVSGGSGGSSTDMGSEVAAIVATARATASFPRCCGTGCCATQRTRSKQSTLRLVIESHNFGDFSMRVSISMLKAKWGFAASAQVSGYTHQTPTIPSRT